MMTPSPQRPHFALLSSALLLAANVVLSVAATTTTPSIQVLTQVESGFLQDLANKFDANIGDDLNEEHRSFCQFATADSNANGRRVGVAFIDRALGVGLKETAGINPFAPEAEFFPLQLADSNKIRSVCSILTQSSHRHADGLRHMPGVSDDPSYFQPIPVVNDGDSSGKAAFVFLESNPDAHFSWGDRSVPVEKGNMVVFDGSVPHQTIIGSGTVQLLGPFDTKTFRLVGPIDGIADFIDTSNITSLINGITNGLGGAANTTSGGLTGLATSSTGFLTGLFTTDLFAGIAIAAIAVMSGLLTAFALDRI